VVEAPAASAPWFFVVSVTAIVAPAAAEDGASRLDTTRSGPIWIEAKRVLFVSLVSGTAAPWSACAMIEYPQDVRPDLAVVVLVAEEPEQAGPIAMTLSLTCRMPSGGMAYSASFVLPKMLYAKKSPPPSPSARLAPAEHAVEPLRDPVVEFVDDDVGVVGAVEVGRTETKELVIVQQELSGDPVRRPPDRRRQTRAAREDEPHRAGRRIESGPNLAGRARAQSIERCYRCGRRRHLFAVTSACTDSQWPIVNPFTRGLEWPERPRRRRAGRGATWSIRHAERRPEGNPVSHPKKLAILVGGGPAPGINSVISAATIRAALEGVEVVGIRDGFEWIMQGDIAHVTDLTIDRVSRIHFRGGSHIGISRANPTLDPAHLENMVISLLRLNISQLITIGGDDTAYSALKLEERAAGRIRVVHVPKTIDNDLALPPSVDTFGFQTARHYGVDIVKNLMVDAKTTSRWYFVIAMGRKAGHLALGIGKAAGATLTLIPEEFPGEIRLKTVVDTLVGAIIKRLSDGRRDGVAMIAEGLVLELAAQDLARVEDVERDAHGNVRIAEVNIGEILKAAVARRLKEFGIKTTIVAKNIGYELRCADPIPYDMEYTRDLGYCAAKYLLAGGNGVMISMQGGQFVPIPFADMIDAATGRARLRLVDIHSTRYSIARRYMIRLRRDDFEDPHELAKFAATAGVSLQEFRNEFAYLIDFEPPALVIDPERHTLVEGPSVSRA
jgi:6-phosphofructokinase 1